MTNSSKTSISWDRQTSLAGIVSRKTPRQHKVRATTVIWQTKNLTRLFQMETNPIKDEVINKKLRILNEVHPLMTILKSLIIRLSEFCARQLNIQLVTESH